MLLAGTGLVFMWFSGHVGLASNLAADTAAKAALLKPVGNLTLPYPDYFPLIRNHVLNQWQASWSLEIQNKLHAIEPTVNKTKSYRLRRRDEIIIHQVRVGHTFSTFYCHKLVRLGQPCHPTLHCWFTQRNWILSSNLITKFYVCRLSFRVYVCTTLIFSRSLSLQAVVFYLWCFRFFTWAGGLIALTWRFTIKKLIVINNFDRD